MQVIYLKQVKDFLSGFNLRSRNRIIEVVYMLENQGHLICMPASKSLGNGLFELRAVGKEQVRIIYCFHKGRAYLLRGFIKKSWKIHRVDIEMAKFTKKLLD